MACGFGATLLVWLLMDHQRVPTIRNNTQLSSEVRLLEEDITEGELGLVRLRLRQSSELSAETGESSLHFPPDQSGHANPILAAGAA